MMTLTFYNISKVSHREMLKFYCFSFFASCLFYEIGQKGGIFLQITAKKQETVVLESQEF